MLIQTGDIYRCSDPLCGCEIQVLKGPEIHRMEDASEHQVLLCCCGKEMKKFQP